MIVNWFCILLALLLSGCCSSAFYDAEDACEVAPNPGTPWECRVPYCNPFSDDCLHTDYFNDGKPRSLAELVDLGLTNNPITRKAWADAKSRAYTYKASQSILYPQIDAQADINFIDQDFIFTEGAELSGNTNIPFDPNLSNISSASSNQGFTKTSAIELTAQYLLFDFGGRCATIQSAWQALLSGNMMYNQAIQDVLLAIISDYYIFLESDALVIARKEDLQNAKKSYEFAEAQFTAGIKTKVDLLQAESNLANSELELQRAINNYNISLANLAKSVGISANTKFEVEKKPFTIPKETIQSDIEYLMSVAKAERADLASRQADYMQKVADLAVVKSNSMPNLTANVDVLKTHYSSSTIKNSHIYVSTISLNIPLFYGFFYTNQKKKAEADILYAYEAWKQAEDEVLLQVVTSYYNFQTAVKNLSIADDFLKYSQEAYDALGAQYLAGISTFTDLLVAEATLANAKAQQILSRTRMIVSFAQLTYSMGILDIASDYSRLNPLEKEPPCAG